MLEELQRLHDIVGLERRVREETGRSMVKMFEDVDQKIRQDVAVERTERESAEGGMLRVIEDTCSRIISRASA